MPALARYPQRSAPPSLDDDLAAEPDYEVESEIEFVTSRSRKHKSLGDMARLQRPPTHVDQTLVAETYVHETQRSDRDPPRLRKIKEGILAGGRLRPKSLPLIRQSASQTPDDTQTMSSSQPSLPLQPLSSFSTGDPSSTVLSSISSGVAPRAKALTPILEQFDNFSTFHSFDSSSSSFISPAPDERDAIKLLDRASGVVFGRVDKGSGGRDVLPPATMQLGSPAPVPVEDMHAHAESLTLPSFVLTVPTPQPASSPIFVSHSPFTSHKFVAATATTIPISAESVPLLPRCSHVAESGAEEDEAMCRTCEMQMLACKVWYQGSDAGRRQALREPYIRPGESNANNRAMMEMLGFPAGVGLGLADEGEELEGFEKDAYKTGIRTSIGAFLKRHLSTSVQAKARRRSLVNKEPQQEGEPRYSKALQRLSGLFGRTSSQGAPAFLRKSTSVASLTAAVDDLPAIRGRPTSFLALDSRGSGSTGFELGSARKNRRVRLWKRRISLAMRF